MGLVLSWLPLARITDFAAYWAAGHQVLDGGNPYAIDEVAKIEHKLGFAGSAPLVMRNPPWTLALVLPFGALSYPGAQGLWLLASLIAVLVASASLWHLYDRASPPWLAAAVVVAFVPVEAVLAVGQVGPFLILGIAGFMHFERRRWDGCAGVSLYLLALKPHLVFLFWPALCIWAFKERRWRIPLGLSAALLVSSAVAIAVDPAVFSQYFHYWKEAGLTGELTPTIAGLLRLIFGIDRHWLALVPVAAALIWLFFHCRNTQLGWVWASEIPLLMAISMTATPYGWLFDQIVLLPAILQALSWVKGSAGATRMHWVTVYLLVNGITLALILLGRPGFWYCWTAPAWLFIFLAIRTGRDVPARESSTPT